MLGGELSLFIGDYTSALLSIVIILIIVNLGIMEYFIVSFMKGWYKAVKFYSSWLSSPIN